MYTASTPSTLSIIPYSASLDVSKHTFSMALAPGDILVLATDDHDEHHLQREALYPVALFYMDAIADGSWQVITTGRKIILGHTDSVNLHPFLNLSIQQPLKTIRNHKGNCTVFNAEITHGYRLHFLDFVKNRLPEIYRQLDLD